MWPEALYSFIIKELNLMRVFTSKTSQGVVGQNLTFVSRPLEGLHIHKHVNYFFLNFLQFLEFFKEML